MPIVVGDCSHLDNGMAYDVPGGGKKGSNFVARERLDGAEGLNGRLLIGASHHHGGAKYQTLESRTCRRRIFKAPAYHGTPDHVYNTIRPILHEPGPIGNGTFATSKGVPITEGEVLRRVAVHDNHNLHVASMGFWSLWIVPDDSRQALREDADRHGRHQPAEALRPHAELRPEGAAAGQADQRCRGVRRQLRWRSATTSSGPGRITARVGETGELVASAASALTA